MAGSASIFWDFNLPNSTTWFYFAFLLAVALFFKFARVLSMRNWDVVTLFLLVPGLLLLQEARHRKAMKGVSVVGQAASQAFLPPSAALATPAHLREPEAGWTPERLHRLGYLILLLGSGYLFMRCLIDLVLVQRPALAPNLNFGGLAWLAMALFICLMAVAFRADKTDTHHAGTPRGEGNGQGVKTVGRESAPLAMVSAEEEFLVKRAFAVACHLAVIIGLIFIGRFHFQDAAAGMAAATFYLMLPYTGFHVGQAHHIWPVALVVWALAAHRWPILAGVLLGLASATAYFPALVVPLWFSYYWRRGAGRFLLATLLTAGLCLTITYLILMQTDDVAARVREALSLPAWQPWKNPGPEIESFWTGIHWAYRIPVFIAYLAFVVITSCWPNPKNLAHVIALSAAVLIGIQFWYADQGGVYVLWYLPLLTLLVFRPNLSDRRPLPIQTDTDWLTRLGRWLARILHITLTPPPLPEKEGQGVRGQGL